MGRDMRLTFLALAFFSAGAMADVVCLEDAEYGYKCFEKEFVRSAEELTKPMLRKGDAEHAFYKSNPATSSQQLYRAITDIAGKQERLKSGTGDKE